jgi:hypothetical protein
MGETPAAGAAVTAPAEGEAGQREAGLRDFGRAQADQRGLGATRVRVADGPLVGPVLRRVVSIVLARADWPLDRLDEALLVCDALCAHAPAQAGAGMVAVSVRADEREAELRVRELTADGAAQILADATLPMVGNVIERIAESVSVERGENGGFELVVVLSYG